jgi:hypothetical protein
MRSGIWVMATVAVMKNKTTMKGVNVVQGLSGHTPGVTSAPMAPTEKINKNYINGNWHTYVRLRYFENMLPLTGALCQIGRTASMTWTEVGDSIMADILSIQGRVTGTIDITSTCQVDFERRVVPTTLQCT